MQCLMGKENVKALKPAKHLFFLERQTEAFVLTKDFFFSPTK